jgi:hypothetical protein
MKFCSVPCMEITVRQKEGALEDRTAHVRFTPLQNVAQNVNCVYSKTNGGTKHASASCPENSIPGARAGVGLHQFSEPGAPEPVTSPASPLEAVTAGAPLCQVEWFQMGESPGFPRIFRREWVLPGSKLWIRPVAAGGAAPANKTS